MAAHLPGYQVVCRCARSKLPDAPHTRHVKRMMIKKRKRKHTDKLKPQKTGPLISDARVQWINADLKGCIDLANSSLEAERNLRQQLSGTAALIASGSVQTHAALQALYTFFFEKFQALDDEERRAWLLQQTFIGKDGNKRNVKISKPVREKPFTALVKIAFLGIIDTTASRYASVLHYAWIKGIKIDQFELWLAGEHVRLDGQATGKGVEGAYNAARKVRTGRGSERAGGKQPDKEPGENDDFGQLIKKFCYRAPVIELPASLRSAPRIHGRFCVLVCEVDADGTTASTRPTVVDEDLFRRLLEASVAEAAASTSDAKQDVRAPSQILEVPLPRTSPVTDEGELA